MDYFLSFPNDTRGRGLVDAYLRMKAKTSGRFTAGIDVHSFSLANKDYTGMNQIKKVWEPSLIFNRLHTFHRCKSTGWIFHDAGNKNMEAIKGGDKNSFNYWAFVMLKVSPVFLNMYLKIK